MVFIIQITENKQKGIISGGATQKVDSIICLLYLVSFYGVMYRNPQWKSRNVTFMFIKKEHKLKKKKIIDTRPEQGIYI